MSACALYTRAHTCRASVACLQTDKVSHLQPLCPSTHTVSVWVHSEVSHARDGARAHTHRIQPNPHANRCHSDRKNNSSVQVTMIAALWCECPVWMHVCVCACRVTQVTRDQQQQRSASTPYQQFSLRFSTETMGLPVAMVTALVDTAGLGPMLVYTDKQRWYQPF